MTETIRTVFPDGVFSIICTADNLEIYHFDDITSEYSKTKKAQYCAFFVLHIYPFPGLHLLDNTSFRRFDKVNNILNFICHFNFSLYFRNSIRSVQSALVYDTVHIVNLFNDLV